MKNCRQYLLLSILLFITSQFSFGQSQTSIKGTISDGKLPVEFVDVILKNTSDSTKIAAYTVTDASGSFVLDNIINGDYQLQFKLIGFKTNIQKVKFSGTPLSIGTITLQNDTNLLNTVVVNSAKKTNSENG
ncbi:carboxypeptidase-like regulatory domain-containing protein [Flavobacterium sp. 81]|uniref:carboxypeptidase-like regulatory domain-containing protein n=1 Tax=Flavobacterium sp. 81 TaxID=2135621 RepID=UPI001F3EF0BD|nr:carboxypeptidase-like regulatory domain-containing protein [Flavobacterium sp. 81]